MTSAAIPVRSIGSASNVSLQSAWDAVRWYGRPPPVRRRLPPGFESRTTSSDSRQSHPTIGHGRLRWRRGSGSLSGHGSRVVYSPGGVAEWRYRNDETAAIADLLFGDLDGDGRTDVLSKQRRSWLVSWAGASKREKINESDGPVIDFAVETSTATDAPTSFTRPAANGACPTEAPLHSRFSTPRRFASAGLRFGDFDADGRTDVFAVIGNGWYMRRGGRWPLGAAEDRADVVRRQPGVADFNGDGWSDVALSDSSTWKSRISRRALDAAPSQRWTVAAAATQSARSPLTPGGWTSVDRCRGRVWIVPIRDGPALAQSENVGGILMNPRVFRPLHLRISGARRAFRRPPPCDTISSRSSLPLPASSCR